MGNHRQREEIRNSNPFQRPGKVPTLAELTGSMVEDESSAALAIHEDGSIQMGGFTMTPTGLLTDGNIDFDEWQEMGMRLSRLDAALQWLIGDWIVYGHGKKDVWGEKYEEAIARTDYSYSSLTKFAHVASRIPFFRRRKELTYSHHMEVVDLPEHEQDSLLDEAVEKGWSIRQLREAINPTTPDNPVAQFRREIKQWRKRFENAGESEKHDILRDAESFVEELRGRLR